MTFPAPDMARACGLLRPGAGATGGARAMLRAAFSPDRTPWGTARLGLQDQGKRAGPAGAGREAETRPAAPKIVVHPDPVRRSARE